MVLKKYGNTIRVEDKYIHYIDGVYVEQDRLIGACYFDKENGMAFIVDQKKGILEPLRTPRKSNGRRGKENDIRSRLQQRLAERSNK